jgi:hypothetical protein
MLTLCLTLYFYRRGMVRFDNPEIPATTFESVAKFTAQILIQPVYFLWTGKIGRSLNSFEWVLFFLNSCLWGVGFGWLFARLGER